MCNRVGTMVKWRSALLVVGLLLMLCSCSTEVSVENTIARNGKVYLIGETKPFTGFVTGTGRGGSKERPLQYKKQYCDGVLCGKSEYYHENGKLEGVEPYKNGVIHGIAVHYYDTGQMRSRVHFMNGLRGGHKGEAFWDKNGNLLKGSR